MKEYLQDLKTYLMILYLKDSFITYPTINANSQQVPRPESKVRQKGYEPPIMRNHGWFNRGR